MKYAKPIVKLKDDGQIIVKCPICKRVILTYYGERKFLEPITHCDRVLTREEIRYFI